jgi:hypothetical protein
MASITLKNIPEDLLDALRQDASRERRSLNQQALYLIQVALRLKEVRARTGRAEDSPGGPEDEDAAAFKEFLRSGPLGDIELERIAGPDRDIDL